MLDAMSPEDKAKETRRQEEICRELVDSIGVVESLRRLKVGTFRASVSGSIAAQVGVNVILDGVEVWRGWWNYDFETKAIEWREERRTT